HELLWWYQLVEQAQLIGLFSADHLAGKNQLAGFGHADQPGQEIRPTPIDVQSTLHKGLTKPSRRGRDTQIRRQRQLHPSPRGWRIHRCDDRLGGVTHSQDHLVAYGGNPIEQGPLPHALLHLMRGSHVATSAKATPGASNHDDPCLRVIARTYDSVVQLL